MPKTHLRTRASSTCRLPRYAASAIASSLRPKCSSNADRPASVTITARPSRTRVIHSCSKQWLRQRGAGLAGDVEAPLAPVEAGAAEGALAAGLKRDAVPGEEGEALRRHLAALVAERHAALRGERIGKRHAQPPGQVVVAEARLAHRHVEPADRAIARRRLDGGDDPHQFDHLRHQRRGDAEVAVAALLHGGEQLALRQPSQMLAGRGGRYARGIGKLAGGLGAAVHQRVKHRRARRVAHQRADLGKVDVAAHVAESRARRARRNRNRFGPGRSDPA